RKVIQEHSTIGVVVTTDGTIGEIPRADYVEAEQKVIEELKEVGKPFIMVVNSMNPTSQDTELLRQSLSEDYDILVLAMSIEKMIEHDVHNVFHEVLYEFPVFQVNVNLPSWFIVHKENLWIRVNYQEAIQSTIKNIKRHRYVDHIVNEFRD